LKVLREEEESVTEVIVVLYTQETSMVLWSGAKSNFIPTKTYLQRSINSEQLFSIFYNRSPLSVVVIYKFYVVFFQSNQIYLTLTKNYISGLCVSVCAGSGEIKKIKND